MHTCVGSGTPAAEVMVTSSEATGRVTTSCRDCARLLTTAMRTWLGLALELALGLGVGVGVG